MQQAAWPAGAVFALGPLKGCMRDPLGSVGPEMLRRSFFPDRREKKNLIIIFLSKEISIYLKSFVLTDRIRTAHYNVSLLNGHDKRRRKAIIPIVPALAIRCWFQFRRHSLVASQQHGLRSSLSPATPASSHLPNAETTSKLSVGVNVSVEGCLSLSVGATLK